MYRARSSASQNNNKPLPGKIEIKVITGNRKKLVNFNDLTICYRDKLPEQLFPVHMAAALRHCFQDTQKTLQLNAGYSYISSTTFLYNPTQT